MARTDLLEQLARYLAATPAGEVPEAALQALRRVAPPDPRVLPLLGVVASEPQADFHELTQELETRAHALAARAHDILRAGDELPEDLAVEFAGVDTTPGGWQDRGAALDQLEAALQLQTQWAAMCHGPPRPAPESASPSAGPPAEYEQRSARDAAVAALRHVDVPWSALPVQAVVTRWLSEAAPKLARPLSKALSAHSTRAREERMRARSAPRIDDDLGRAAYYAREASHWSGATPAERHELLDGVLGQRSDRVRSWLLEMKLPTWARVRAGILLTLRRGGAYCSYDEWLGQMEAEEAAFKRRLHEVAEHVAQAPEAFLTIWLRAVPGNEALADRIERTAPVATSPREAPLPAEESATSKTVASRAVTEQPPLPSPVADTKSGAEHVDSATGSGSDSEAETAPEITPEIASETASPDGAMTEAQPTAAALQAPRFSLWGEHLQPMLMANWYIIAGILMVVVGSSLVAYFTWDRHWLIRYTILPTLLAGFTAALAWLGGWLERRDRQLAATATLLRGAAIGLLPINFMTINLLAGDPDVVHRVWVVTAAIIAYLLVFGRWLGQWCGAVFERLRGVTSLTLLFINALVLLGPVGSFFFADPTQLNHAVSIGFYAGFVAVAASVVHFQQRLLTADLLQQKRVPWFLGVSLAMTYLQVFGWVHVSLWKLPQMEIYAPLVILAGGLVLLVERRASDFADHLRGESFLGFALILGGCLMGYTDPALRIVSFALAGIVWLYQGEARKHVFHEWIGLSLLALAVAAVTLLDGFPGVARPAVAIGVALALTVVERFARPQRAAAAGGLQVVVLILGVVIAVLSQWRDASPEWITAAYLLVFAAGLSWRAHEQQRLTWLHSALVVVALALPYLGFVDLQQRTLRGNTMVFGLAILSILWILRTTFAPSTLTARARSTVLWSYGSLAVAAMLLRVVMERAIVGDVPWYHAAMDYAGPLLMAGVLAFATYYSRSLIPAAMAAVILVILFPELKARFQETFTTLGWGSGLGSASSALGVLLLCFPLRRARFLQDLPPGDRFLDRMPFPLRCHDHRLYTVPMVLSALFLTLKTDTWTLLSQLTTGVVTTKTALGLGATGLTWGTLAVYFRRAQWAPALVYVGAFWCFVAFGVFHVTNAPPVTWHWPVLAEGIALQAAFFVAFALEPRWPWVRDVLLRPVAVMLEAGAVLVAAALLASFTMGEAMAGKWPLVIFCCLQLAWHGVRNRHWYHGTLLFVLVLAAWLTQVAPGQFPVLDRGTAAPLLTCLGIVASLQLLLESRPTWRDALGPALSGLGAAALGLLIAIPALLVLAWARHWLEPAFGWPLGALLLLAARTHRSTPIFVYGSLVLYMVACRGTGPAPDFLVPRALGLLTTALAATTMAGLWLQHRAPRLIQGPVPFPGLSGGNPIAWMGATVACTGLLTLLVHLADGAARTALAQLWAPYLVAFAFGWMARAGAARSWLFSSFLVLALANVHAVNVLLGGMLRDGGLSDIHIICLGFAVSLLLSPLLQRHPSTALRRAAEWGQVTLAGGVLLLLVGNYATHPDLAQVTSLRFVVSGALALLGAFSFRASARRFAGDPLPLAEVCRGGYFFGITLAFWCAALLIPQLRSERLALLALALPGIYFALRCELTGDLKLRAGYRHSATVISVALLVLYVSRSVFQMVLFPWEPIATDHYHSNAYLGFLLGPVLLRMRAHGGGRWVAHWGGVFIIICSYFAVTALPGLSPFEHSIGAAWTAVVMAHVWTLLSTQPSPLRAAVQQFAAIDDEEWHAHRRGWGIGLLLATHGGLACLGSSVESRALAPLVAGLASVVLHHGMLRRSSTWLFALAAAQLFVAVHLDFVVPSYLLREHVIWVMIAAWGGLLAVASWRRLPSALVQRAGLAMAAIVAGHVLFHQPFSSPGLWGAAVIGAFLALGTRDTAIPRDAEERAWALAPLVVLPWLAFFWMYEARGTGNSVSALKDMGVNAPLAALTAVFLIGAAARALAGAQNQPLQLEYPGPARLFGHTYHVLRVTGARIHTLLLGGAFPALLALQALHYATPMAPPQLFAWTALYAGFAIAWWQEGRSRESAWPFVGFQLAIVGLSVAARNYLRQLELWQPEYDVWLTVGFSMALTGLKQVVPLQRRGGLVPVNTTLFLLPIAGLVWTQFHGLGVDVALLVVGLQGLIFAYLGKDSDESPFTVGALALFCGFVLLGFWEKFEIRVIHAYVIPVGVAILALQHIFRRHMSAELRNRVRLVTILSMLASSGYYALADDRYPVAFNGTMLGLCVASMLLGSLLRVRLYLVLGFCGIVVNLASIVVKVIRNFERNAQMMSVGSLILLTGIALVAGAVYFKTHRAQVAAWNEAWRQRLRSWE